MIFPNLVTAVVLCQQNAKLLLPVTPNSVQALLQMLNRVQSDDARTWQKQLHWPVTLDSIQGLLIMLKIVFSMTMQECVETDKPTLHAQSTILSTRFNNQYTSNEH